MPLSPEQILSHMQVPEQNDLYIIGAFEKRLTVYSQQIRALNLIYALKEHGKLHRVGRACEVCIVGAGVAGLTAALAAASFDCAVTVLEERDTVLPTFEGNFTRWIHPNIYDWPAEGSTREETNLPFLNWRAGLADHVRTQIEDAFMRHPKSGNVFLKKSASHLKIHNNCRVQWYSRNTPDEKIGRMTRLSTL